MTKSSKGLRSRRDLNAALNALIPLGTRLHTLLAKQEALTNLRVILAGKLVPRDWVAAKIRDNPFLQWNGDATTWENYCL